MEKEEMEMVKLEAMELEEAQMLRTIVELADVEFVYYNIILKGLMKMNHTYTHLIAPPPCKTFQLNLSEEGVKNTFLHSEEGVS